MSHVPDSVPPPLPQLNGIVVLNKPSGPSSGQCLYALKKLGQKKIGHAGTLDPLASGVLLVLLGAATKISGLLLNGGAKVYTGVARLGVETDTWDMLGHVVREAPYADIAPSRIESEVKSWLGESEQVVPAYSAAKHNGKPLYKLARKNLPVPEKRKKIEIFEAGILDIRLPFVRFRVACSSGSYIRSLAHSLGKRLGCGAALSSLTREFSHPFSLETAVPLARLKAQPQALVRHLRPLQTGLPDWPIIELSAAQARAAQNGQRLDLPGATGQKALLAFDGQILAMAGRDGGHAAWSVTRGLWN